MKRKTITAIISLCLTMVFTLSACGSSDRNPTNTPSQEPQAEEIESEASNSRLQELEKNAEEANQRDKEKEQARERERQEEEARRQEARDAVTTNGALLDALVGQWGYITPSFISRYDMKTQTSATVTFIGFAEDGSAVIYYAYDKGDLHRDTTGKLDMKKYNNAQFAIDETKSEIVLFFTESIFSSSDPSDEKYKEYKYKCTLPYKYENGKLSLTGLMGFSYIGSDDGSYNYGDFFKANWDDLWDEMIRNNSALELSKKYPQYIPSYYDKFFE